MLSLERTGTDRLFFSKREGILLRIILHGGRKRFGSMFSLSFVALPALANMNS
jgi:hypothetical protein